MFECEMMRRLARCMINAPYDLRLYEDVSVPATMNDDDTTRSRTPNAGLILIAIRRAPFLL